MIAYMLAYEKERLLREETNRSVWKRCERASDQQLLTAIADGKTLIPNARDT